MSSETDARAAVGAHPGTKARDKSISRTVEATGFMTGSR
jgi:hypothetical protein